MTPEENNKENKKNKPKTLHAIRTFKSDTSEYIEKGDLSVTDLLVKQQKQKPISYNIEERPPELREKSKIPLIIIMGFLVIIAGGISAYFFLAEPKETQRQGSSMMPPKPILTSDEEIILEIKNIEAFKNQIKELALKQYAPGYLVYLPVKKQIVDAVHYLKAIEFLNVLEIKAPTFLTAFLEDNFFLGLLNLQKKHVVLIFEIERGQYDNVFAGMIRWEKTLLDDLDFVAKTANLTEATPVFKDKIIKNQSTRIVESEKGTILVYTILNRKYIIITTGQDALEELIRLFTLYKFS